MARMEDRGRVEWRELRPLIKMELGCKLRVWTSF